MISQRTMSDQNMRFMDARCFARKEHKDESRSKALTVLLFVRSILLLLNLPRKYLLEGIVVCDGSQRRSVCSQSESRQCAPLKLKSTR